MATVFDKNHFRSRAAASHGNGGSAGGSVDETQRRLTAIETTQAETKVVLQGLVAGLDKVNSVLEKIVGRLCAIEAVLPHLATKADLNRVEGDLKKEVSHVEGELRTEIAKSHAATIKWVIGTALAALAAAYAFVRIVKPGAP